MASKTNPPVFSKGGLTGQRTAQHNPLPTFTRVSGTTNAFGSRPATGRVSTPPRVPGASPTLRGGPVILTPEQMKWINAASQGNQAMGQGQPATPPDNSQVPAGTVQPFLTPDQQTLKDATDKKWGDLIQSLQGQYDGAPAAEQIQEGNLVHGAAVSSEQAQALTAARGVFDSSITANDLSDITTRMNINKTTLQTNLGVLRSKLQTQINEAGGNRDIADAGFLHDATTNADGVTPTVSATANTTPNVPSPTAQVGPTQDQINRWVQAGSAPQPAIGNSQSGQNQPGKPPNQGPSDPFAKPKPGTGGLTGPQTKQTSPKQPGATTVNIHFPTGVSSW